mmetsp:Transcript_18963/g.28510  ORF Transcript_18963/g.28510 Transcript_18963/m.28510 type:complete len:100 (+) Transcript_18963:121-420(+)
MRARTKAKMKVRQLSFKDERWDKQKKKKRGEWEIGSKRQWGWGYEWGRRLVVKAGSVHESQLPQRKGVHLIRQNVVRTVIAIRPYNRSCRSESDAGICQ